MRKTVSRSLAFLLLTGAALVLVAVGLAGEAKKALEAKGTIRIATQSPLSGPQEVFGDAIKRGAQLALDKLKGSSTRLGWKVELVPFDDEDKPDVAVRNAKHIVNEQDILLVIGHLSSRVTLLSSEVYREVDLAMISPASTDPKLTDRKYRNVNRVCGRDDAQGEAGARFAKDELKINSAYVLHDKTLYGQAVAEVFRDMAKKLGVEIRGFEGTEEKANFDPIITPIKAKNPDLVYFGGIYSQAAIFLKQMREKGVEAKFLGPDGMDSSEMVKIAGKAAVGMYYSTITGPPTIYPEAAGFAKDFKAKFKKDPEPFAALAYDATAIALKAIEAVAAKSKPTRAAVAEAIRKTKNYKGLTGTITFDEKGDPVKAKYFIFQVVSDDPAKWGESKLIKTLEIEAPPPKR